MKETDCEAYKTDEYSTLLQCIIGQSLVDYVSKYDFPEFLY